MTHMASNFQQFDTRYCPPYGHASEIRMSPTEQKLAEIAELVHQLAVRNRHTEDAYENSYVLRQPTDRWPVYEKEPYGQENMVSDFPGQPHEIYDPYSDMHDYEWRDHPYLDYGNPLAYQAPTDPYYQEYQLSESRMSLEEIILALSTNNLQMQKEERQFQQETRCHSCIDHDGDVLCAACTEISAFLKNGEETETPTEDISCPIIQRDESTKTLNVDNVPQSKDKNLHSSSSINVFVKLMQDDSTLDQDDELEVNVIMPTEGEIKESNLIAEVQENNTALKEAPKLQNIGGETHIELLISNENFLISVLQESSPKLKHLPNHLEHPNVGEPPPLVISKEFIMLQEEKLVHNLRKHKPVIGGNITNPRKFDPSKHHDTLKDRGKSQPKLVEVTNFEIENDAQYHMRTRLFPGKTINLAPYHLSWIKVEMEEPKPPD